MSDTEPNVLSLDAAYKPFPTFERWVSQSKVEIGRWERYKATLEANAKLSPEKLQRARQIAKRAAALDTGAIEGLYEADRGFTFTVAFESAAWEAALAQKGEHVRPLFDAQLAAYDYVLSLATKAEPISEAAIRVLHETVCRAQDTYRVITAIGPQEQPLPKGQYKIHPNHVRTRDQVNHSYAPVDVTPAEMQRLVVELRSQAFLSAHPVQQAAYAHYGLVVIHPFADGNGRVARALASVFAYRALSMPIVILSEQKGAYLDSLEKADAGQYQAFVNFVLDRFLDTIQLVDDSIRSALAPNPESVLEQIDKLYFTKGGFTEDQIDKIGLQLLDIVTREFQKIVSKFVPQTLGPPPGKRSAGVQEPIRRVSGQVNAGQGSAAVSPAQKGLRVTLNGGRNISINFQSAAPAHAGVARMYSLFVPRDAQGDEDVVLVDPKSKDSFAARLDEINPSNSGILQIRAAMFVERAIGEMLAELKLLAEASIKSQR